MSPGFQNRVLNDALRRGVKLGIGQLLLCESQRCLVGLKSRLRRRNVLFTRADHGELQGLLIGRKDLLLAARSAFCAR